MSNIGTIENHQSRIIEADSWKDYCKSFEEYNGDSIEFKILTSMTGETIPKGENIYNLEYDDYHLSCNVSGMKKLAYICD